MDDRCPRKPERSVDDVASDDVYLEIMKSKTGRRRRLPSRVSVTSEDDEMTAATCTDSWSSLNDDSFLVRELQEDNFMVVLDTEEEKHVSFSNVLEIREYAVTVGDSPSCHGPCPLQLDWCHSPSRYETLRLPDVRQGRGDRRVPRVMSAKERLQRVAVIQGWEHVKLRHVQVLLEKITLCILDGITRHEYLRKPDLADISEGEDN